MFEPCYYNNVLLSSYSLAQVTVLNMCILSLRLGLPSNAELSTDQGVFDLIQLTSHEGCTCNNNLNWQLMIFGAILISLE